MFRLKFLKIVSLLFFIIVLSSNLNAQKSLGIGLSLDYSPLIKYQESIFALKKGNGFGYSIFSSIRNQNLISKIKFSSFLIKSEIGNSNFTDRRNIMTISLGYFLKNKKLPKFEFPISILVGAGPKIRNIFSSTTVGIDLGAHYFISNKVSSFFEVSHLADWFTKPKELSIKNLFILSLGIKYNLADL
jgi:hypothetical protein